MTRTPTPPGGVRVLADYAAHDALRARLRLRRAVAVVALALRYVGRCRL